jgi:hypothetical protein
MEMLGGELVAGGQGTLVEGMASTVGRGEVCAVKGCVDFGGRAER